MMTVKYQICIVFALLIVFGQIFASTDGVIGVFSPRLVWDGRPILWQNVQSDSATAVQFFQGERYNFFGVIIGEDSSRVYAGLNTAGFGLVYSAHMDGDDAEAALVKQALGICGRLDDFADLLAQTTLSIGDHSSFACMDAFGGLKLYEAGVRALDPFDLQKSPDGFLIRANFNFSSPQTADDGFWRYHRARNIIQNETRKRKLHHHVVIKQFARDVESRAVQPYPLPFQGDSGAAPSGYIECKNSINQFNTVSCVVIHGVRAGENPDLATMWVVVGEPSCGVAVPLWPATSQVPPECRKGAGSLNILFQQQKRNIYDLPDMPEFMNTNALVNLRTQLDPVEIIIFAETRKALSRWRDKSDYHQEMIDFQMETARHAAASLPK